MTDHENIINLHNGLYSTVQRMKQFVQIFGDADRRDYVTAENIPLCSKTLSA